ncbi:hypothetical protein ACH9DO_02290 [Kocuria sp. M1N1S27]|uniref:hypothetical protein n=1 Tax=Kocuria kalidii TaxID=3376283 RepID=UPI0037B99248
MSGTGLQRRPASSASSRTGIGAWTARRGQRPPVEGSSARQLEHPAPPAEESTGSTRAPLSVVPGRERRRRISTVVISLLALVLALASILVLNIQISGGQYRLVELRAQEQALSQQNEALTQDLEFYNAPQNLAVMATDLGMVPAQGSGTVDLTTGTVEGDPLPAQPQEDHEILVEHAHQTGSVAADRAAQRAEAREQEKAEQEREDAERRAREDAPSGGAESGGGSLSAPLQRIPGE